MSTPPDHPYKLAQREAKRSKGRYRRIAPPPGSAPGEHLIEDSRGRLYRQEKDGSLRRVEPEGVRL